MSNYKLKFSYLLSHKGILNFINYYIFTIINSIISIYSISYLTKHLLPEDYGMIGLFGSILFFTPSLISFSTNGLQAIEIVDLDRPAYLKFRNGYISFILISTALSFILAAAASYLYKEFCLIIMLATLMGFLQTLSSVHNTELIQHAKPTRFGLISTLSTVLSFLMTVLFLSVFSLGWEFRILAILIVEFIIVIIRFYILSDIGSSFKFNITNTQLKYLFSYGAPLMLSVLLGWILNQSDRYFLLRFFTIKEVGLYAAAAGLASFIVMINSNMIKVVYPFIYEKLSNRTGKAIIYKVTFIYSGAILFIALLFCLGIHFFGHLFFGEKFLPAMPIVFIMCFAQALFGVYSTTGLVIDYFKKTKLKTILVFLSALAVVGFSFLLIPIAGLYGPALALLISFLILSVLSFIISRYILIQYNIT